MWWKNELSRENIHHLAETADQQVSRDLSALENAAAFVNAINDSLTRFLSSDNNPSNSRIRESDAQTLTHERRENLVLANEIKVTLSAVWRFAKKILQPLLDNAGMNRSEIALNYVLWDIDAFRDVYGTKEELIQKLRMIPDWGTKYYLTENEGVYSVGSVDITEQELALIVAFAQSRGI